jgi:uncharacterized protein (TIGR03118 family)
MKRSTLRLTALLVVGGAVLFGRSAGPDPRKTAAPGDEQRACTQCHAGTLNSGAGSVQILLASGPVYQPGVKQRVKVQVSDPDQKRWGFQLTARIDSSPENGQAGDFSPVDDNTRVICDNGAAKPCPDNAPVQFIEHTSAGTRPGTPNGATFEFDWTPPATNVGTVTLYVAGNAANNDGRTSGDHIYTSKVQLTPGAAGGGPIAVPTTKYLIRNLVSDMNGIAEQTDPKLVNPWGIALGASTAFWLSNANTGTATVYNASGQPFPLAAPIVVKVTGVGGATATPTGQINNPTPAFEVQPGKPATFLFSTADGVIAGWNRDVDAANTVVLADRSGSGASYKGLAMGVGSAGPRLYAVNFRGGTIDTFDGRMQLVSTAGGFTDPKLPAGFAPFNILRVGGSLVVAYAVRDDSRQNPVAGAGNGILNVFDLDGNLIRRLVSGGMLNSPWGMVVAPQFFGDYGGSLLVGNFGDGSINAFDLSSGNYLGTILNPAGNPERIEGLWALQFGNGKNGGDANLLYFTAGPAFGGRVGDHGLFGSLQVAP